MTIDEWDNFIFKIGRDNRQEQKIFFNRTSEFIKSKEDVLLNPAGMGLGKTLATSKVIFNNLKNYEMIYIANPTSPLKEEWSKNLNECNINDHIVWFAKSEMCIKKKYTPNFREDKNCNDDCEYRCNLESNGEYKLECEQHLKNLKFPITPYKYYKLFGECYCLLPICRLGLKTRKVLVGDYFGILNSTMFNLVTKHNEFSRNRKNSLLIVDEAHLLHSRTKEYLSKTLSFDKCIREMDSEINCDYLNRGNLSLILPFRDTIKTFEKIKLKLLKEINQKDNIIRYSFSSFKEDYSSSIVGKAFTFDEMIRNFKILSEKGHNNEIEEYENENDTYCKKFINFLTYWKLKEKDEDYTGYFQYSIRIKDSIKFFINCQDTSKFLSSKLGLWKKVILNSGTISDLDYFKHHTGLEKMNVSYMPMLNSFSIKNNVIIYPFGNFTSRVRDNTYTKNKFMLQAILKNLSGRTIIFIQSKNDSKIIDEQIKEAGINTVNFCLNDNGFETNKIEFDLNMDKFNDLNEGIGIMNINGRVEGYNFKSTLDDTSVSNIIVYGYPFPKRGMIYDDEKEYLVNILKSKTLASKWIDYVPTLDKIHQACMRSKRKKEDMPIILLWDNQFGKGEKGYDYMPDDLKGEIIFENIQLLNKIRSENDKRKNSL